MALVDWLRRNKKYFLPIIGIAAFFLYIYIFNTNILQIAAIVSRINLLFFGLALLIGLGELFFFALSWRVLLDFLKIKISSKRAFLYVLYSYYMDIIVPAGSVTGDVARVYLITKEKKNVGTEAAASVFMQRLLGMVLHIVAIVIGIFLIIPETGLNRTVIYYVASVGGIISFGLGLLILLTAKKSLSIKIVNGSLNFVDKVTRKKWNVSRWSRRANEALEKFRASTTAFKNRPRVLTDSMAFLVLNWVCSFSIPYVVFLSLGYSVSWSVIIITASIVVAVRSIPIGLPFEVGIPEITMTTLFVALGVPAGLSATVTILTRVITLWFRFALGFFVQQWIELKPKNLKIP